MNEIDLVRSFASLINHFELLLFFVGEQQIRMLFHWFEINIDIDKTTTIDDKSFLSFLLVALGQCDDEDEEIVCFSGTAIF